MNTIQSTEFDDLISRFDLSHPYNTPTDHLFALYKSVKGSRPRQILELGSFKGYSAAVMMVAGKRDISSITCVDPSFEITNAERQDLLDTVAERYNIDCERVCIQSTSEDYLNVIKEKFMTFNYIFHDAKHGREMIPEFLQYWNHVRPEGVLAIHDFEMIGEDAMKEEGDKLFDKFFSPKSRMFKTDASGKKIAFFLK